MAVVAAAFFGPASASAEAGVFAARLATVPIGVPLAAPTHGSATGQLEGRRLTVEGTFQGLQRPAMGARLHVSAVTGVRGPAVADLTVAKAVNGRFEGAVDLDDEQVAALREGRLYVQIDSEDAPAGKLWGWLLD